MSERRPEDGAARPATLAQLRAVLENIDEGLVVAGADGYLVTMNQHARAMIGLDASEQHLHISAFARHLRLMTLDGRELAPEERPIARTMRGERFADFELRCERLPSGGTWIGSFAGTPVLDEEGRIELAVLSARDITERVAAEEAVRETARQKDAFLATLGHELRNPLSPILQAAQMLERADLPDPRQQQMAAIIGRQSIHLMRIVDDLLEVSRITRGQIVLQPEPLDLVELVRSTVEDQRSSFGGRELTLALELPDEPMPMRGDPTRIAQVLDNLLTNAMKFTPSGGKVTVGLERDPAHPDLAVLRVSDTGIGIEPGLMKTLWEPFTQGPGETRYGPAGLGLGTALIRRLVELHGGEVSATSEGSGRGTTFTARLPLGGEESPVEAPAAIARRPSAGGGRVLIVEDNADVLAIFTEAAQMAGHEVRTETDGRAAVTTAVEWHPQMVLCDIGLGGAIDGYAVAVELRAAGYEGRLVAITGYGQREDRQRALDAGFDDHLAKPVPLERFEALLAEVGA